MLLTLALAGLCLTPPLYATDGPPCALETAECRCSECLTWDAATGATRYEVVRETISTGAVYTVGAVYSHLDEDGTLALPTLWCVADDSSFPHDGTLYRYQVRACNASSCSAWSNGVQYRGSPYACFVGGREVACYLGDSVVTR